MNIGNRVSLVVVVIATLVVGAAGAVMLNDRDGANLAQAQERDYEHGISVSGEGIVTVVPDMARVVLGVHLDGEEIEELRDEASERMDDVISGLQAAGIVESDIKTVTYDISVARDWNRTGQPIIGYTLIHLLEVRVTDLDTVGSIIDGAIEDGANSIGQIQFEVEDRAEVIREARALAVENAFSKAEHLAELTGVGLGQAIKISESSQSLPPVYFDEPAVDFDVAEEAYPTPIEPGETSITVHVNVVYAID